MRILAVSVAPLFPDRIQGGSQRILMDIVDALAESGHDVRVLSPDATETGFHTPNRAAIEPVLQLRGSFPAPYQTAPHRLTSVWKTIQAAAEWADRAYLHADAIYMRGALNQIPVVRSLHDFVYEEALLSAFALPAARTIVPSEYMRDCIEASAGTLTDVGELMVVRNGLASHDLPIVPRMPTGIAERRDGDLVLLHPHRLHREKGIEESIRIAAEVRELMPERRVRLLAPALEPGESADNAAVAPGSIMSFARSVGAEDLLELHEWLPPESMPGYLATGDVTLCPGSFVESFGLTPLESVAAGTPAVCSLVGAFREQIGLDGITHVDYGDVMAAAKAVVAAVSQPFDAVRAASQIMKRYSLAEMRAAYVDLITGELPAASIQHRPVSTPAPVENWELAPWCYVSDDRIYHDYLARFESFPGLARTLSRGKNTVGRDFQTSGKTRSELSRAQELGFVVPA